jgi:hypothetical protein
MASRVGRLTERGAQTSHAPLRHGYVVPEGHVVEGHREPAVEWLFAADLQPQESLSVLATFFACQPAS